MLTGLVGFYAVLESDVWGIAEKALCKRHMDAATIAVRLLGSS